MVSTLRHRRRGRGAREVPDRRGVPVFGEAAEHLLESQGHPHVGQGVAAQAHEGAVVGDVRAAEDLGKQCPDGCGVGACGRLRGRRGFGRMRQLGDGAEVGFARGGSRKLVDGAHPDGCDGKTGGPGGRAPDHVHIAAVLDGHDQFVRAARAAGRQPVLRECRLDVLQVDP